MSLPAALLSAIERHGCFSGCYRSDSEVLTCIDPTRPLEPVVSVACTDCLTFHPGALASLLPLGMTGNALAAALTAHVRTLRSYRWAAGGYHTKGGGFWLSAAYYGDGLFLVDASRNRSTRTDVEVLADAFRHGVLQPEDPRMVDPSLYTSELSYLNMHAPITNIRTKQDLLASPQRSATPRQSFQRVSIVEFQPLVAALASAPSTSTPAPSAPSTPAILSVPPTLRPAGTAPRSSAPPRPLTVGQLCPRCGSEVQERPLFTGTYLACRC
ncbi:hypothetical protein [Chondromyces crocatus]|uniref:Uncharacterized protein n=1 Tax=Chondromyces crocatus TaxID=52 RepID=A0A0K1EIM1_CHOCO|nr:hypothetical protein [Chondromyces crocatus]AKT40705.1 uncharacterized protein CMC5_048610 [Chondromyces crocatus]